MSENPKNELANDIQFKPTEPATVIPDSTHEAQRSASSSQSDDKAISRSDTATPVIPDRKSSAAAALDASDQEPHHGDSDPQGQAAASNQAPLQTSKVSIDPRSEASSTKSGAGLSVEDDKAVPQPAQQPAQPAQQPSPQPATTQPSPQLQKATPPKKPKSSTRVMIGCFGAVGGFLILIILTFILIVSQTGLQDNPIFKALGIDPNNIHSFLLTLSNIIFGLLAFVTFILAIIGIFRFSMAKKDDTTSRKKGLSLFIVGATLFVVFIFFWMTLYVYLSGKVQEGPAPDLILTDPPQTIGLTAPLSITFDASEIPLDERRIRVISFVWDFGDDETGTGETVQHTYKRKGENNGRYTAKLTITYEDRKDNKEGTIVTTRDVVFDNEKVNALFTVSEVKGSIPFKITANAGESLDPDGEITAYEWDFDGDGDYDDATGVEASYTYEQVGSYQISLRVTDNNNEYDTEERTVDAVAPEAVTADIKSLDETFYSGKEYTFEAGDSWSPFGDIEKYEWDFGDGSSVEKTRTVKHIFQEDGQYEVHLKVTDETEKSAETTLSVAVGRAEGTPVAKVKTLPEYETDENGNFIIKGTAPLTVQFDLSGSTDSDDNIVEYTWDFNGDGAVDEFGAVASYAFEKEGQYNVTASVVDAKENTGVTKILVDVSEQGLEAKLTADAIDGVIPLTVNFDASGSSYPDGKIVSYTWNFGDGTAPRVGDAEISHRYETPGTYKASVEVATSDGKRASAELDINVRPIPLTACFTPSIKQGPAPLTVSFNPNCSTGTIVKYTWDFGGETSRDRKPTHVFENPGNYEVTLEIVDSDNVVDRYSDTIVVQEGIGE